MHLFTFSPLKLHNLAHQEHAASNVKLDISQWKATLRDDFRFPTVYRRIYCRKFLTLSIQMSRYIHKCITM